MMNSTVHVCLLLVSRTGCSKANLTGTTLAAATEIAADELSHVTLLRYVQLNLIPVLIPMQTAVLRHLLVPCMHPSLVHATCSMHIQQDLHALTLPSYSQPSDSTDAAAVPLVHTLYCNCAYMYLLSWPPCACSTTLGALAPPQPLIDLNAAKVFIEQAVRAAEFDLAAVD